MSKPLSVMHSSRRLSRAPVRGLTRFSVFRASSMVLGKQPGISMDRPSSKSVPVHYPWQKGITGCTGVDNFLPGDSGSSVKPAVMQQPVSWPLSIGVVIPTAPSVVVAIARTSLANAVR